MYAALRRPSLSLWFLVTSFTAHRARAQSDSTFVWGFQTLKTSTIQECARIQIFVGPNPGAQPPYTLIAYEANGIPTVQTLGSDLSNLWWNVDHAAGSQLVLSMADGSGNSGGVATDLFSVVPGTTTSCHPQNPSSPISITTNTTKTLNSCDILPLKISGGQKPYKITVAALDSTSVTNVSMGVYDEYDWVNRASPNSKLIATVSDATGTYGAGTALLSTAGSTDLTCNGRQSTLLDSTGKVGASQSGTAAVAKATGSGASSSDSNDNKTKNFSLGTIIGGAVGGVVLVGALVAGLLFFLRKRTRANGPRQYFDNNPRQGFGLGKVGGAGGQGAYTGVPVAEEITPFVAAGVPATPYRDHDPNAYNQRLYTQSQYSQSSYNQSSYSSGADTMVGALPVPDQYGRFAAVPQLPPGAAGSPRLPPGSMSPPPMSPASGRFSPPASAAAFNSHNTYSNVRSGSVSASSVYSVSTAQPSAIGRSASASAAGPVAGGSGSTGLLSVANPSDAHPTDVKGGAEPSQPPQPVYQHEDVADVEELPPAYKERPT